jgi:hypothetical protein
MWWSLAAGRVTPWAPRRFGGRDLLWWAQETGFLDGRLDSLPAPEARLLGVLVTGRGRGPDLHLRTLQARGVTLTGHFLRATDRSVLFASLRRTPCRGEATGSLMLRAHRPILVGSHETAPCR